MARLQRGGRHRPVRGGRRQLIAKNQLLSLAKRERLSSHDKQRSVGIIEMNNCDNASARCCAECGKEGGVSLKTCKACMSVKYCNASCQHKHWPKHKIPCKEHAAELRDEALFKDPPPKEDCPICFIPMPSKLICCVSLPPATISSVPINDFVDANEGLANLSSEQYYPCCGKSICRGCIHSFVSSDNINNCPFCKSERTGKTHEEKAQEMMKRVEANDASAMCELSLYYHEGHGGLQQDQERAIELLIRAVELGSTYAHFLLGNIYDKGGYLKKTKFHLGAAAMAGNEVARYNLGAAEAMSNSGNKKYAMKHYMIAASSGCFKSMNILIMSFEQGIIVCRDEIDSTLTAYNKSCVEMRSEARDAYIRRYIDVNSAR